MTMYGRYGGRNPSSQRCRLLPKYFDPSFSSFRREDSRLWVVAHPYTVYSGKAVLQLLLLQMYCCQCKQQAATSCWHVTSNIFYPPFQGPRTTLCRWIISKSKYMSAIQLCSTLDATIKAHGGELKLTATHCWHINPSPGNGFLRRLPATGGGWNGPPGISRVLEHIATKFQRPHPCFRGQSI